MAYTLSKLAMINATRRYIPSRFILCGEIIMGFILYDIIDLTKASGPSFYFKFP